MKSENNTKMTQLEKEGWERKFTIEEHRVDEYRELYESLDQEVRVEPVVPSEMEGCTECFKVECDKYRTIYTRSKQHTSIQHEK
ncbi:MAG: hypothetical protein ACFE95_10115 [Candidatus Hodarchaeota archaeon]